MEVVIHMASRPLSLEMCIETSNFVTGLFVTFIITLYNIVHYNFVEYKINFYSKLFVVSISVTGSHFFTTVC